MQLTGNVQGMLDFVGGSDVEVTPILESGTKIATIEVDGVGIDLYAPTPEEPTSVEVTQVLSSGTKIASIEVDGVSTDIFAPAPPEVNHTYYGTDVPSSELGNNGDTYYKYNVDTSHYDDTLLNVNIPAPSSDTWVVTEGVLEGVSTIYGVGSWFYGAVSKVINVADIPDYPTTPRENFLYGNNNSNSSIAKSGNDLYLYVHGGMTISSVYSRVYTPTPTSIAAIYIKVDGVWITT